MKKKLTQISLALFLAVGSMATLSSCGGEKTEEATEEGKKCEEGKCEEGKCEEGKKCEGDKKCEEGKKCEGDKKCEGGDTTAQ